MLLLFDIDGTLIRCGGAGRKSLDRAFAELHGVEEALKRVRLDGSTDPLIVRAGFEAHLGRVPSDHEFERLIARYLEILAEELACAGERYVILPGVEELMPRLDAAGRFILGLATGNDERGARLKLEIGGLNRWFTFGGYGSDAAERAQLVARGIERGQALAMTRFGRVFPADEIVVFGDTANDVLAAKKAGARAVGVLHGAGMPDELLDAKPDLVVDSFADPRLHTFLRLNVEEAAAL